MSKRVTWHACRRYLERACEVDVVATSGLVRGDGIGEREIVEAACENLGLDVGDVRRAIWTPEVRAACLMNTSRVDVPLDGQFAVVLEGRVVSVTPTKQRRRNKPKRQKFRSKREGRKASQAMASRGKTL
jgi:hypothetical protein